MKRYGLIAIGMVIGFLVSALAVSADEVDPKDIVPRISYGVLTGLTRTAQDGGDSYHNDVFNGFGAEVIGYNAVNKTNGYNIVGISAMMMMAGNSAADEFSASPGIGVKFMGNFLVGATYDLLNTNRDKRGGFVTGDSSWKDNGAFWVGLIGPLNGGGSLFNLFK